MTMKAMNNRCTRCRCDKCKGRKYRRWAKRIILGGLIVLFMQFNFTAFETMVKRQDRLERNHIELESKVSAVQAAVVETKVALSTKESAETVSHEVKPVETAISPKVTIKPKREVKEVTYVDPVSATTTAVLVGALQIGKHVIMEGGRIYDGIQ